VSGKDGPGVAECIKLFPDAGKEEIAIATGKVPAPDPASEEDVTADEQFVFTGKKAEAYRTMSRHVEHLEIHPQKIPRR